MDELTQPEGNGRTMIESLSQEFDQNKQFGAQTVSYFKNPDNDTEFQFFGGFLALTISAYTGMRVSMSASPIPEMRSRDFQEFAKDRQWIHTGLELLRRDCATVRTTGSTPSSGIADQVRPCPAGFSERLTVRKVPSGDAKRAASGVAPAQARLPSPQVRGRIFPP